MYKINFYLLLTLFVTTIQNSNAQHLLQAHTLNPHTTFDNILVTQIEGDSTYTAFVIWIKKEVPLHYHSTHTETIIVLSGKGVMTLGDTIFRIKKHDKFVIPKGKKHAVVTKSRKPLKVISIQYPMFDGTDRVMIKP